MGPVLWFVGEPLYNWLRLQFQGSDGGPLGLEIWFLLAHVITLPLTNIAAYGIRKQLDKPAVEFGHMLYNFVNHAH